MAQRIRDPPTAPAPPSARDLVDKYSGVGLQFKVKFVGSENVSRKRGDAEAARYCIPTLRLASKNIGAHKPKAALGLSLKGISLYDEITKSVTRVPVDKITYVSHDPVDLCFFGIIISTSESHTGFKLYCFKADKPVSVNFVNSSKELFELMLKLRQAKKRIKEEKEKAQQETEQANQNPDSTNLPVENAPPPSYVSVTTSLPDQTQVPPERPPPPRPLQPPPIPPRPEDEQMFSFEDASKNVRNEEDPQQKARDDWSKLESDLNNITQDLRLEHKPLPGELQSTDTTGLNDLQDLVLGDPSPLPTQQMGTNDISTLLNPFGANNTAPSQPQIPSNPYAYPQSNFGILPPSEPSITLDLVDAIKNPPPGTTSYMNPMGTGMGSNIGMGPNMGMGLNMGMGPNMGMVGMTGAGSMGMGNPYGNPYGNPSVPSSDIQTNPFGLSSNDILSMPADPLLETNFSQPLLPTSIVPTGNVKQKVDAFSDLVNMARDKAKLEEKNKPEVQTSIPTPLPPPRYSSLFDAQTESVDTNLRPGLFTLNENPPPSQQGMFESSFNPQVSNQTPPNTQTPSGGQVFDGFDDDFWGNSFSSFTSTITSPQGSTTTSPPQQTNWISF